MAPTMSFHTKTTVSPPRRYQRPLPDPAAEAQAAKANELLNMRSKNISHIMAQRTAVGPMGSITLPEDNPRANMLHKELGIDKVVLVKSPFQIDTTPGGFFEPGAGHSQSMEGGGKGKLRDSWAPGARVDAVAPPRVDAVEYSYGGHVSPAYVDGRLLRGGWAVA